MSAADPEMNLRHAPAEQRKKDDRSCYAEECKFHSGCAVSIPTLRRASKNQLAERGRIGRKAPEPEVPGP